VTWLTHKDVTAMLGPVDDVTVAEIIATGATAEELGEAKAWLTNDEALMNVRDSHRYRRGSRTRAREIGLTPNTPTTTNKKVRVRPASPT
jgi:hypothetical protein